MIACPNLIRKAISTDLALVTMILAQLAFAIHIGLITATLLLLQLFS